MVKLAAAALFFALLSFAVPVRADSGGGKAEYEKAVKYSKAGEYEAALPLFERAYVLSNKRPSTILALAQCERELKMYDAAIGHFREYLAGKPAPKDAPKIEETIALLEDLRAREKERLARAAEEERQKAEAEQKAAPKTVEDPPKLATVPAADPKSNLVVEAQPAEDSDSILESPIFWIISGVVVVGGGIALGVALSKDEEPYGGSTGISL